MCLGGKRKVDKKFVFFFLSISHLQNTGVQSSVIGCAHIPMANGSQVPPRRKWTCFLLWMIFRFYLSCNIFFETPCTYRERGSNIITRLRFSDLVWKKRFRWENRHLQYILHHQVSISLSIPLCLSLSFSLSELFISIISYTNIVTCKKTFQQ